MSHCKECRSILDKFEVDTCKACGTEAPSVGTKADEYMARIRKVLSLHKDSAWGDARAETIGKIQSLSDEYEAKYGGES
jgi:hypothetical protein